MTKEFYTSFLNYIGPKELRKLYLNLREQKLPFKGFSSGKKTPPIEMLAPQIAKSEKIFFNVLEEQYVPAFDNCDDATNSFTPDTAVTCLTYFVKSGMADESFLTSLMTKGAKQEPTQFSTKAGKAERKTEEFREKYLSTRRELLQVKENYAKLQSENTSLKSELAATSSELNIAKEKLQRFEKESSATVDQLKKHIQELEESISKYQLTNSIQSAPILLMMDADESIELDVDTLTYDNISKLFEVIDKYDEILLVINDVPFAIKRKIQKIDALQDKLVTFSTKQEMIEYAKQRRND